MIYRILLSAIAMIALGANAVWAQSAAQVVDKVIAGYNGSRGISAAFNVATAQGTTAGTIDMMGQKFRILSPDMKCWFDGKTQWTYTKVTGEVNVTTPTATEIAQSNPYAIISSMRSNCTLSMKSTASEYVVTFKPKKKGQITQAVVTIGKKNYQVQKAVLTTADRNSYTTIISHYTTGKNFPASTFVFNKSQVPSGTEVVDLR